VFPEGKTSVKIKITPITPFKKKLKWPIMIIQCYDDYLKIFSQIIHKSTWSKCPIATKLSKQQYNTESTYTVHT